ncbi:MAG: CRISPR-associated helicase Cas3' [Lysobacterales bacterium]
MRDCVRSADAGFAMTPPCCGLARTPSINANRASAHCPGDLANPRSTTLPRRHCEPPRRPWRCGGVAIQVLAFDFAVRAVTIATAANAGNHRRRRHQGNTWIATARVRVADAGFAMTPRCWGLAGIPLRHRELCAAHSPGAIVNPRAAHSPAPLRTPAPPHSAGAREPLSAAHSPGVIANPRGARGRCGGAAIQVLAFALASAVRVAANGPTAEAIEINNRNFGARAWDIRRPSDIYLRRQGEVRVNHSRLQQYWGKASEGEPEGWHPLVFHALDVAAVVHQLLRVRPRLTAHLAALLHLPTAAAEGLLVTLAAWHDLGKFAENFQYKRVDIYSANTGLSPRDVLNSDKHHDAVSAALWCSSAWATGMAGILKSDAYEPLVMAAFGHHGRPPSEDGQSRLPMSEQSQADALQFATWAWQQYAAPVMPADWHPDASRASLASWWIAGLVVLGDWLGSNTRWFPYANAAQRSKSWSDYWQDVALPNSQRAVAESGMELPPPAPAADFARLFPSLAHQTLRPAQALAVELSLPDTPQLLILEDATGSGKTEAALMLAHRLMAAGMAEGLFFGLPTQATADQMYDRVDSVGARLFAADSRASIVLAHGARDSDERFQRRLAQGSDDHLRQEADTASLGLNEWLGQSVKRALLANLGIGTLDQAQMAALRVKHQPLRLLGLFGKVLIVDEVHAYDAYMTVVLKNLLTSHALAGGSAILLSATLPESARSELLAAFFQGVQQGTPAVPSRRIGPRTKALAPVLHSRAYPMLTHWSPGFPAPLELPLHAAQTAERTVRIDYVSDSAQLLQRIAQASAEGRCVCWIRNTVGDALQSYQQLVTLLGAERVQLFHSRFALVDRQRIQKQALGAFNKYSLAAARRGRVLVATQVVEQSLDLDFDWLISDLAPIELLLQRQGRLRRHCRDAAGNPVDGPDQRGDIVYTVYGPDRGAQPDADWYRRFFPRAAFVYPMAGELWLAAQALGERLILPQDFRRTVDEVYSGSAPACFALADARATGETVVAPATVAESNICAWPAGYRSTAVWTDDERIPTRLGESIDCVLASVTDGGLRAYAANRCTATQDEWELSSVRLPGNWGLSLDCVDPDPIVQTQIDALRGQQRRLRYRPVLVLRDGHISLLRPDGREVHLDYDETLGLARARPSTSPRERGTEQ